MAQSSYFWEGTATGDATIAPYDNDEFSDLYALLFTYDRSAQGVIPTTHTSYLSMLEVTCPAGATARVANGAAVVDGKVYLNTANVDNTVSGNAVYWVIGLQKDWAAQTVRIFARGNYLNRAAALAALVKNDGVTWEIPLATILTTAGGDVSTIRDEREFLSSNSQGGMVRIYETIVGTGGSQVDWQNIPNIYRSLRVVITAVAPTDGILASSDIFVKCNNDGGANYNNHDMLDLATVYDSHYTSGDTEGNIGTIPNYAAGNPYLASSITIDIENYKNIWWAKYLKYHCATMDAAGGGEYIIVGNVLWVSNVAINRLTFYTDGATTNFLANSIFTLYGIF